MNKMDLDRVLTTIGKGFFIKYFVDLMSETPEDCIKIIEEDYTEKSKRSRVGHAKMIFAHNLEKEALKYISKSERVERCWREQALIFLQDMFEE